MLRIGAAVSGAWNENEEVVLRLYYDMECNDARTEMSGRFILFFFICNYSEPCKLCNSSAMQKCLCKMTVGACSLRAAYTIISIGRTPDMK